MWSVCVCADFLSLEFIRSLFIRFCFNFICTADDVNRNVGLLCLCFNFRVQAERKFVTKWFEWKNTWRAKHKYGQIKSNTRTAELCRSWRTIIFGDKCMPRTPNRKRNGSHFSSGCEFYSLNLSAACHGVAGGRRTTSTKVLLITPKPYQISQSPEWDKLNIRDAVCRELRSTDRSAPAAKTIASDEKKTPRHIYLNWS